MNPAHWTRDMRRAALLVLDAAAEVASLYGGLANSIDTLGEHGATALNALWVAHDAWEKAQSAAPASARPAPVRRKPKPKEKRQATADVRAAVLERANGLCECGCARPFVLRGPELDHFFGRARSESVESCWVLRSDCHHRKTNNVPNAAVWLEKFRAHCVHYNYWDEAKKAGRRLAYVEAKEKLGQRLKAGGAK